MENKKQAPFQYILDNVDIVSVVKNFINLQKKGQNYWGLCPFHGDKNPSLSVNSSKKIFKCFVCGVKGNVINFVMNYKKINFPEALKEITKITNVSTKELDNYLNFKINSDEYKMYEINKQASFIYNRTLFNSENKDKLNYLLSRNLTNELIQEYGIGYAPKSDNGKYLFSIMTNENNIMGSNRDKSQIWTPIQLLNVGLITLNDKEEYNDFFWNRITIPIFDEYNNIVGFSARTLNNNEKIKYINTKTTSVFKKENVLFNFNNFDKSSFNEIFVVEGYMDVFAFRRMGIQNVVASMGTSFTMNQINILKKYPNINTIILCFDNDDAGYNATLELAKKLMTYKFNIFVVEPYDNKFKDVDELLKEKSIDESKKIINNQISLIKYVIIKTFKNKNLNEKEIIIETKKIIDMINEFGYSYLTITQDLEFLSLYSKINIDDLKNTLKNNSNSSRCFKTNKNENIYSYFEDKKINFPFLKHENTKTWKEIRNNNTEFNVKKEYTLMQLIASNSFVAELYIKYVSHIYFQKNYNRTSFELMIFLIKRLIANNIEVSVENIIALVQNDTKQSTYHKFLIEFLTNLLKNKMVTSLSEKQKKEQGISLIIEIIEIIYKIRRKQIILDDIENDNKNYELKMLSSEFNLQINELNKILLDIRNKGK